MTSDRDLRPLGWGAYGVALLLVGVPVLDSLISIWPLQPGNLTWRFGAVGLFSRSVMSPLFGLLVGLVTAVVLEHHGVARALSVASLCTALLALGAMGVFVFDALETRGRIQPGAVLGFDAATGLALLKYGAGVVIASLLGVGGWRGSRASGAPERTPHPDDARQGLVVGRTRGARAGSSDASASTAFPSDPADETR